LLTLVSPAKVNLFLHVTGKRPDGYHTLVSLMCPIGLRDTLHLAITGSRIRVNCGHPYVPEDQSNLAHVAAERFFRRLASQRNTRQRGVTITIDKHIPVAAGLGGGSSNAAAVLIGLNRCFDAPFSAPQLVEMGLAIGADVPFFLYGKPALATGIGERLRPYPQLRPYSVLVIYPGIRISTAEVYKNLDLALTNCKKKLKDILLKHRAFDAALHSCNDLESVTLPAFPEVRAAKSALLQQGAEGALMSGSGSAVFGLFTDPDKARDAEAALAGRANWQLYLTETMTDAASGVLDP
jgi:4-diphosphocytidyl-2-C-methyl-D-erythritol kinase